MLIIKSRRLDMVIISPACIENMEEILALQKSAYLTEAEIYNDFNIQPLTQTLEETIAEARNSLILKAVIEGKIVGSVRGYEKNGICFIGKLMVLQSYRNQGIGKKLMKAIEDAFPNYRYELFTGYLSVNNLALYEGLGYRRFKTEKINQFLQFIYLEKVGCSNEI